MAGLSLGWQGPWGDRGAWEQWVGGPGHTLTRGRLRSDWKALSLASCFNVAFTCQEVQGERAWKREEGG